MAGTKRISRAQQVEEALRWRLDDLCDPTDRLPSETEIASMFEVSRVTVRQALSSLERKGLIRRQQGLGTFVNRSALEIQTRLDESIEFGDLIRRSGRLSESSLLDVRRGPTTPTIAKRLSIDPKAETLTVRKLFTADKVPVIYCLNVIPLHLAPADQMPGLLDQIDPAVPVYTLLAKWFGHSVAYQIADIEPRQADEERARLLACEPGHSLLYVEEVGYNLEQQPAFYAEEYYVPGIIRFRLVRKPF